MRKYFRLLFIFSVFALNGCTTTDQQAQFTAKWNGFIGRLTYSDMVKFNGSPASKETLPDGDIVAKWTKTSTHTDAAYTYYDLTPYDPSSVTYGGGTQLVNRSMILTFDSNGVLKEWVFQPN